MIASAAFIGMQTVRLMNIVQGTGCMATSAARHASHFHEKLPVFSKKRQARTEIFTLSS